MEGGEVPMQDAASSSTSSSSSSSAVRPAEERGLVISGKRLDFSEGLSTVVPYSEELLLQDEEKNKEQQQRNNKLRNLLRSHKEKNPAEVQAAPQSLDFISIEPVRRETGSLEKALPWFIWRPYLADKPFVMLHEELIDLILWLQPSAEEEKARGRVLWRLEKDARELFPDCLLECFGSYYTGLYLPTGDVDVCLRLAGERSWERPWGNARRRSDEQKRHEAWYLKLLAKKLLEKERVSAMEVIEFARVPIVKLVDKDTGLPVDICYEASTSISTSRLVLFALRKIPALRPLILLLKLWLQQRGMDQTYNGGIGSYLLFTMVTFFFQQHPLEGPHKDALKSDYSLGHYLFEFFEFWAYKWNYERNCYDITRGTMEKKHRVFPDAWKDTNRGGGRGDRSRLLSAVSPLEPAVDIGKNSFEIQRAVTGFKSSRQNLMNCILKLSEDVEAERRGRDTLEPRSLLAPSIVSSDDPVFLTRKKRDPRLEKRREDARKRIEEQKEGGETSSSSSSSSSAAAASSSSSSERGTSFEEAEEADPDSAIGAVAGRDLCSLKIGILDPPGLEPGRKKRGGGTSPKRSLSDSGVTGRGRGGRGRTSVEEKGLEPIGSSSDSEDGEEEDSEEDGGEGGMGGGVGGQRKRKSTDREAGNEKRKRKPDSRKGHKGEDKWERVRRLTENGGGFGSDDEDMDSVNGLSSGSGRRGGKASRVDRALNTSDIREKKKKERGGHEGGKGGKKVIKDRGEKGLDAQGRGGKKRGKGKGGQEGAQSFQSGRGRGNRGGSRGGGNPGESNRGRGGRRSGSGPSSGGEGGRGTGRGGGGGGGGGRGRGGGPDRGRQTFVRKR
uniref:Poly(A) RNA polymerase mitochondrial-like central palm domain-containing protein n=1 Tax=Chromera velia CCMP2878 TaxID=1169474 RepID=A0A0G4FET4_9ALVE|eukprot:Cvel_3271.t1-p1 / transcript=Cvel_3271.t1 / gene=Cvel_3271 / organism=Chromera_velia_CCMP2878 / gene_product=PAP-associated domain-containing protein 5, putative / transcript_product=PAP-associated domain-containing protein 5, putative / location=Cvel_scaffold128:95191-103549(+) / protein_length=838 / sequence_SO=supercontig / SO=protein_coding / is_pseudo=false